MLTLDKVAVGFLAGGKARRMGGKDKPFLSIGGQTILHRQLVATAPHKVRVINANGDLSRFNSYGLPVIPDILPDWQGPLAGILSCLDWLADAHTECDLLLSCAADAPFIPSDLAARLLQVRTDENATLAQASSSGRRHPVFGLWPVSIRQDLRTALIDDGLRKIDDFTDRFSLAVADFADYPDPFSNVNRPIDIVAAEAYLDS